MTFSVFMFAVGGYAVIVLAGLLVVETTRDPVPQQPRTRNIGERPRLRTWPRLRRDCPAVHERPLPLRSARQASPARRRRPAQTSCRR